MAVVNWLGVAQAVPGVKKVALAGTPAAGNTVTLTVTGSAKFVRYTLVSGDTAADVAAALLALWQASADGELREITAAIDPTDSAALLFTGPADGATFAVASSETGGGITGTDTTVTTETGPHDASNVLNYSTGTDTLEFRDAVNGPQYNLTALAAVLLANVKRYETFTGRWGLPERNVNGGYQEYRGRYLQLDTDAMSFEAGAADGSEQFLWQSMAGAAPVVLRAFGRTNPAGGQSPSMEFFGTVGASTIEAAGASIGVALRKGQTAVLSSVNVTDGRFDAGDGASALGAVVLNNAQGTIEATGYTTYRQAGSSDVTVRRATAATTSTAVNGGVLRWNSTGTPNTTDVAGGATFDLSFAPAALATISVRQHRGSTLLNPAARIAAGWTRTLVNCGPQDVTYIGPPAEVLTVN
jgi:hypothetical protein